jgi:hypothetical protein
MCLNKLTKTAKKHETVRKKLVEFCYKAIHKIRIECASYEKNAYGVWRPKMDAQIARQREADRIANERREPRPLGRPRKVVVKANE